MKKQFIFFPLIHFLYSILNLLVRNFSLYSIEIGPVYIDSLLHIAIFNIKLSVFDPADHSGHQSMPHPFHITCENYAHRVDHLSIILLMLIEFIKILFLSFLILIFYILSFDNQSNQNFIIFLNFQRNNFWFHWFILYFLLLFIFQFLLLFALFSTLLLPKKRV